MFRAAVQQRHALFHDAVNDGLTDVYRLIGAGFAIPRHLRSHFMGAVFEKKDGASFRGDYVKNHPQQLPGKRFFVAQRPDGSRDLRQRTEIPRHARRSWERRELVWLEAEQFMRMKLQRPQLMLHFALTQLHRAARRVLGRFDFEKKYGNAAGTCWGGPC